MAAVSIRKDVRGGISGSNVKGCIFDIPQSELAPYLEREHRYIPLQVEVEDSEVDILTKFYY